MTTNSNPVPGRHYLAIPGPSVMPDAVLQAMHRAAPNIYEGELIDMMPGLTADLRRVARTEHHVAIYIANGHGVWEAALANTIAPGERVLVPATGRFAHGWALMAQGLGIETQILDFGKSSPWDMEQIADALRADTGHQIKAVLAVHVDTSTSIRNNVPALRALLDDLGHPALLMADCIASMGCDRFEMDAWGVDVAVTGSQKGLMVPPGTAFVFFNDKAAAKRAAMPRGVGLLGLDPARGAGRVLSIFQRHGADPSPLWPASGLGHDPWRRYGKRLGPARASGPRHLGSV